MKRKVAIYILCFLSMTGIAFAQTFNVSTFAELQTALTTADGNNEDDTINISAGTINVTSLLEYNTDENRSLAVIGAGAGVTILDGGNSTQIMYLRAYSDVTSMISVEGITFQNAYSGSDGGGLYLQNYDGDMSVEDCEFLNNQLDADDGGGAFILSHTSISVSNCSFIGNGSDDEGGGLYTYGNGTTTITNSVFSNNTTESYYGGGLYVQAGSGDAPVVNIINNTITGNTANDWGGGLLLDGGGSSTKTLNVYNNIIWGNTSTNEPASNDMYIFDAADVVINLYNNDIGPYLRHTEPPQSTLNSDGNINTDPMLSGDFHLMTGSPCINTGNNSAPELPSTDFEGDDRILDGTVDIGADEFRDNIVPTAIPTMNEWGMIIMSLILAGSAFLMIRRNQIS